MRPVTQSRIGKDGRCFPACLASILELPEAAVPSLDNTNAEQVNDFLRPYGLRYQEVPIEAGTPIPVGYHVICGVSPRGGMHAVVGRDGEFVHDPHPVEDDPRRGVVRPERWGLLTPTTKAEDVHPHAYQWSAKDVPNLRAIISNLKSTVSMIEAEKPITRERQVEANGYKKEILEWERLLAKCGVAERRGARDGYGYGTTCFACGRKLGGSPVMVDTHEDQAPYVGSECYKKIVAAGKAGWQPKGGPRLWMLTEARKKVLREHGLALDRADMMALRRNTERQGGPFHVQLTDPDGREHTESVHTLRAYDADLQPVPPYKPGQRIVLSNGKPTMVHKVALGQNLLGEPEWHILTTSGDYVTVKV